jgi:hypothetical protein
MVIPSVEVTIIADSMRQQLNGMNPDTIMKRLNAAEKEGFVYNKGDFEYFWRNIWK